MDLENGRVSVSLRTSLRVPLGNCLTHGHQTSRKEGDLDKAAGIYLSTMSWNREPTSHCITIREMSCQDKGNVFLTCRCCFVTVMRDTMSTLTSFLRGTDEPPNLPFRGNRHSHVWFCDWQPGMPAKSTNAFKILSTAWEPRNPSPVTGTAAGACFISDMPQPKSV